MTAGIFNGIESGAFSCNTAQPTSAAGNHAFAEVDKLAEE
jgi:hypothetical protein